MAFPAFRTEEEIRNLRDTLVSTAGRIFSVVFVKADGTERRLVGRLGVTRHLRGGSQPYDPAAYNLLTVFDMQKGQYRNINLGTVRSVRAFGTEFVYD